MMEMEVGDDGAAGPSQLGYYKHQTASTAANVTRATHAPPAPVLVASALVQGKGEHAYS